MNPVTPGSEDGFVIRTYEANGDLLDMSDMILIDGSVLTADVIEEEAMTIEVD